MSVIRDPRKESLSMQISRRTDYGVRVILDLAGLPANQRASTLDIAARQDIPGPFLAKIVSQLSVAGLVTTHRGAGGGVALAIPSDEISLLQVIEALDGPLRLNRCLIQPDSCPRNQHCPVHDVLALAQEQLATLLDLATFDSLASAALEKSS
jgi:Rrf2 family protein